MATLIINLKNYPEILGKGSIDLATIAQEVSEKAGVRIIVSPPGLMLGLVASKVKVPVFSQGVDVSSGDKTTGAIPPEAVKAAGGAGTILNHSENRLPLAQIRKLVPRIHALGLHVCLCAASASEAASLGGLKTAYLAVEPPELIGSGIAVSRAKPSVVTRTVAAAREKAYEGKILCGAGIVSGEDVRKALELGADGVLVSSSVVKAVDWRAKIQELAHSLK